MRYDQHAHRREAYGVRGSSTSRRDSLCQSSMSRGEGTRMASHRAFTAGATTTPAAQSPGARASARDATQASGGRSLTRAALYARVSTDKQEREETVASQVDLLQQTAKARGYEVLPGNSSLMTASVARAWIGPPWSGCAISRLKAPLRSCWSRPRTVSPAAMPIRSSWSKS